MTKLTVAIAAAMVMLASPAFANCCGGGAKDGAKAEGGMQCMNQATATGDKAAAAPDTNQSKAPPTGSHAGMDMTKPGATPVKAGGCCCGCCGEKKS